MGTFKKVARVKSAAARKPSNKKTATANRAGGVAFEVADPALKLVTMTGGSFFAEPKFYDAEACRTKRVAGGKLDKLAARLELAESKVKAFGSCDELNDTAKEVIATAVDVASGKSPEDLLAVANWLRNEMNIRLTPQVLLVVASKFDGTKSLVRKYAPHVVKRPDEVKTCLLAYRFLFGMKSLPNGLAHGLGDAVSKFGERGLMKYDGEGFPSWKDVLCWLPRKAGWPLGAEVAKYFISGQVVDPAKTPVIAARKELATKTEFDAEARRLAKASFVNWEVLLSQFPKEKPAVWSFLLDEGLVGYMAMLRNLRNILKAGVTEELVQKVSSKLTDKAEVAKSKQLPFRFLAAHAAVREMGGEVDAADLSELLAAVELAVNESCSNVQALPGTTVVFVDNSGSMKSNKVSEKSEVACADVANVLGGIVARVAERPYVVAFGTDVAPVRFSRTDTVIGVAKAIAEANTKGCSTNTHRCFEWLMRQKMAPDRIVVLSDMQSWNDGSCNDAGKCVADVWPAYLASSAEAKKTWLHCVHLNGYGDGMVDQGGRVNQVGGFSEKVLGMLLQAEGLAGGAVPAALPTVEQIRAGWTVK